MSRLLTCRNVTLLTECVYDSSSFTGYPQEDAAYVALDMVKKWFVEHEKTDVSTDWSLLGCF